MPTAAARFLPLIIGALTISAATVGAAVAQNPAPAPAAQAPAAAAPADTLPEGPGKAELKATCTSCHGLDQIVAQRKTPDQWSDTVNTMVSFGANIGPEQQSAIVAYLTTNFGAAPAAPSSAAPASAPASRPN